MNDNPPSPRAGHPWRQLVLVLLALALIAGGTYEGLFWYRHVYEANAKVEANFTVLSSSVNGNIERIQVRKGDVVAPGQQLASMDTKVAELEVMSLEADLERERAIRRQVEDELHYFLTDLDHKVATARETVLQLQQEAITLEERWRIAKKNVERNSKLVNRSVVPKQRIDQANDKLLEVTGKRQDLQTRISVDRKRLEELEGTRARETIYRARLGVIDRDIDKIVVRLQQARQRLKDMHIYSPIRGVINEIYVNPGAYVEDGDRVFLIHDPKDLWIEANIDESDIRHVKVGQPVMIDIDAYPFEHFEGKVRAIGQVTEAVIRPDKTGRREAGAQKIPVMIDFSPGDRTVWPGMRVAVNIVIR